MLSSPEQRGVGVPSTQCGPHPSQGWSPRWEHPWVQGGVTGCDLGPTLALSPPFCQAPGEEQPPARGGTQKQLTGSWVRRGELRPGTPELPSPCRWVPPTSTPWAGAVARVHPGMHPSAGIPSDTRPFGQAAGRGRLRGTRAASLPFGLGVSPRALGRARSRDSGGFGGAQLCVGVGMGHEIPGDVSRPLLLEIVLAWGQPRESGGLQ